MRLVTYQQGGAELRAGALVDGDSVVLDLGRAAQEMGCDAATVHALASVQALIEAGPQAWEAARTVVARAPSAAVTARHLVHLKAPIQPPVQMRDASCFELHLRQSFAAARRQRAARTPDPEATLRAMDTKADDRVIDTFRRQPIYYKCNRFAVIGADDDVLWPSYSQALDFELEFGCYIGTRGKDISQAHARAHIFGYTIFNDISARDAQALEMGGMLGPAKGKDFDTANVMGPCLVTADELPDPYDLSMIARVNGQEWGRGNTRSMHWRFEQVIAHVSRSETLHPGEFIGSGTVGNGCGLEQLRFLQPGDVVELEIEGLGCLRSRIVREDPTALPPVAS